MDEFKGGGGGCRFVHKVRNPLSAIQNYTLFLRLSRDFWQLFSRLISSPSLRKERHSTPCKIVVTLGSLFQAAREQINIASVEKREGTGKRVYPVSSALYYLHRNSSRRSPRSPLSEHLNRETC